jgi:acetyl esterase
MTAGASWAGLPLDLEVRALLAAEAAGEDEAGPADLAAERAAYLDTTLRLGGAAEPVADVQDLVVPNGDVRLPGALYVPAHEAATTGLIVWLHGGAWRVGDIPTFDRVARALANAAGQKVLLVEYRLVPEHRFPVQVQDASATVAWARSEAGATRMGVDPRRVIVGGDSSGGQLAAAAVRHARSDGGPPTAAQLLVYPALDPAMDSAAYREFADGPMLTAAAMARCWSDYLDGHDRGDPDAAVLDAPDRDGLPPTWIATAGIDPLRDDGRRYAALLREAGVPVAERAFDGMVHGFLRWGGVVERTRELLDWLGAAARAATALR